MYSPLTDVPSIVSASLRSKFEAKLWKKVPWYRVVLDECQELKTATTKIAKKKKNNPITEINDPIDAIKFHPA